MRTLSLLVIGMHDYTRFIKMPTYTVNDVDQYNEWTDANGGYHRDVYRSSAQGTFTLLFEDTRDFENFMTDINNGRLTDGTIMLLIYLNNKMAQKKSYFYVDMTPANELPYMGSKVHDGMEVTIKEA